MHVPNVTPSVHKPTSVPLVELKNNSDQNINNLDYVEDKS